MKKLILQLLVGIFIISCSTTKTVENEKTDIEEEKPIYYDFTGKASAKQLLFIKKNYHWNTEKILIINYKQPKSGCRYDNHQLTSSGRRWWKKYYSNINKENCLNIHVFANGELVKNKLDHTKYFNDKYDFLLKTFFKRKNSCYGVLVMNQEGHYLQYNGHYSEKQVAKFIENLKNL